MGNTLLRDLSIYWCLIHVALIFVMLFQSRFDRKRTWILSGVGIGVLIIGMTVGTVSAKVWAGEATSTIPDSPQKDGYNFS